MSDKLTIMEEEEPEAFYAPGKSKIVFQLIEGDSWQLPGMEFGELQGEGGSWDIEGLTSTQEDAVVAIIQQFSDTVPMKPGWWTIEGFYGLFTEYDGPNGHEYDCEYSADALRPATEEELKEWGLHDG